MRTGIIAAMLATALAAGPALAQGNSGNGGPPAGAGGGRPDFAGGGFGGGVGAGPPMTPPGQTADPRGSARDIAEARGQFGRDFADRQREDRLTGPQRAELQRQRAAD